ncbi:MAG: TRAP transporter small permease [Alphaproteobacteria bacterium]|nr:TRAP transporter small permease [Alphaproteobacteria bacterium]
MQTWLKVGRNLRDLVVVLARGSGAVAALTVLAMCLMITAEVVLRGAFNESLIWVSEIVGYLMVALIFLSLGEAMLAGSHIRIDLLVDKLPKRLRNQLEVFTLALSTAASAFFTWHGLTTALRSYQYGRRDAFGSLSAPLFIPQMALPIGLLILTLVLAALLCRQIAVVHSDSKAPGTER